MAAVKELIRSEENGTLSFGDFTLDAKTKKDGFEFQGNTYKVKTFNEITRLEKNESVVYESIPGTAVEQFAETEDVITFVVSGPANAQITLQMEADAEYVVYMNDVNAGEIATNMSGKLSFSVELGAGSAEVKVVKK